MFFLWPFKWQNMVKVTTSTGEADQCSCESKPKAWWKCFHGREYFMKLTFQHLKAFDKYVVEVFVGSVCKFSTPSNSKYPGTSSTWSISEDFGPEPLGIAGAFAVPVPGSPNLTKVHCEWIGVPQIGTVMGFLLVQ